ncbi:MAG: ATP-binding protein [Phycisphaeraceae bacterium]|nr:ATP-binding protein [Phycisphaeraceae bacterium]
MQPPISERERGAILASLGAGVVPAIGLHHIQVGRREEIAAVLNDLARVEDAGAMIRFIVGRYGSGKTFFLNLVRTVALERKHVVVRADITIDRRLQGGGGRARELYAELMRNLATRSRPDGGGLPGLVERWVGDVALAVKDAGGADGDVERRVFEDLGPIRELVGGHDFAAVLAQYYRGFAANDDALQEAALRWLRAEFGTKTEARQALGVRSIIDDDAIYEHLKLMAAFVRLAGYRGLIVAIDELAVLSHRLNNKLARDRNYEAILRILNDCLQGSVEGLGFLLAATDDCVHDKRRGLASYEALASRLAPNRFASDDLVDRTGPLIQLQSLSPEDCFVMLANIRRVFARADDGQSLLPDEGIRAYLEDCHQRMGAASFLTPRETVRDFVGLLQVLEQNPQKPWMDLLPNAPRSASPSAGSQPAPPPPETPRGDDSDLASFRL